MSDDDYYRQFLQAIWHGHSSHPAVTAMLLQPAFVVYRNTVFKGCVDALQANYPVLLQLTGAAWLQATALAYARDHMPRDASLITYGEDFPAFLSRLDALQEWPYLPTVAVLDRYWTEAHVAADDPLLDAGELMTALSAGRDVCLIPHAAARWHWDAVHPCYTIWNGNRTQDGGMPAELVWQGEGALLTRPGGQVQWRPASVGICHFLDACRAGLPVSQAAAAALEQDAELDIAAALGQLVQAGAFTAFA